MLAVLGALFANGLITVLKFIAAGMTGSSGMKAESLHSLADTTNQVLLLLGLRFYRRPASERRPFGYGKERFFRSFIAAIFIFGVGATYAIYEGVVKLPHPNACEVVELLTMHLAPKQILINAHVNYRDDLATVDIEQTINEVEQRIKTAEPMVDVVFLETARRNEPGPDAPIPQHIG